MAEVTPSQVENSSTSIASPALSDGTSTTYDFDLTYSHATSHHYSHGTHGTSGTGTASRRTSDSSSFSLVPSETDTETATPSESESEVKLTKFKYTTQGPSLSHTNTASNSNIQPQIQAKPQLQTPTQTQMRPVLNGTLSYQSRPAAATSDDLPQTEQVLIWSGHWFLSPPSSNMPSTNLGENSARRTDSHSVNSQSGTGTIPVMAPFYFERTNLVPNATNASTGCQGLDSSGTNADDDVAVDGYFTGYFCMVDVHNTSGTCDVNGNLQGQNQSLSQGVQYKRHYERNLLLRFVEIERSDLDLGTNGVVYKVVGSGENAFGQFLLDGSYNPRTKQLNCARNYIPKQFHFKSSNSNVNGRINHSQQTRKEKEAKEGGDSSLVSRSKRSGRVKRPSERLKEYLLTSNGGNISGNCAKNKVSKDLESSNGLVDCNFGVVNGAQAANKKRRLLKSSGNGSEDDNLTIKSEVSENAFATGGIGTGIELEIANYGDLCSLVDLTIKEDQATHKLFTRDNIGDAGGGSYGLFDLRIVAAKLRPCRYHSLNEIKQEIDQIFNNAAAFYSQHNKSQLSRISGVKNEFNQKYFEIFGSLASPTNSIVVDNSLVANGNLPVNSSGNVKRKKTRRTRLFEFDKIEDDTTVLNRLEEMLDFDFDFDEDEILDPLCFDPCAQLPKKLLRRPSFDISKTFELMAANAIKQSPRDDSAAFPPKNLAKITVKNLPQFDFKEIDLTPIAIKPEELHDEREFQMKIHELDAETIKHLNNCAEFSCPSKGS